MPASLIGSLPDAAARVAVVPEWQLVEYSDTLNKDGAGCLYGMLSCMQSCIVI